MGESSCCPDGSDRFQIRAVSPAREQWDCRASLFPAPQNMFDVLRFRDSQQADLSPKSHFPKGRYRPHSGADESRRYLEFPFRSPESRHSPYRSRIQVKSSPYCLRMISDSFRPRYVPRCCQKSLPQKPDPIPLSLESAPR